MKHTRVEIGQTTARPKFHKRPTGFRGGPGAWRRQGRKRKLGQGSKVIGRAIYRANSKPFQGDFSLFHGPAGDRFHGRAAWQQEKRGRRPHEATVQMDISVNRPDSREDVQSWWLKLKLTSSRRKIKGGSWSHDCMLKFILLISQ